jgi:hypothetical protein
VIIDEAGVADTLSLDTAVNFILQCGGSVQLVGDDQQLEVSDLLCKQWLPI